VDADRALSISRQQQRAVIDAARTPPWLWLVTFVVVYGIFAVRDAGADARSWTVAAATLALLAWTYLPRVWPAFGRIRVHPGIVALHTRMVVLVACLGSAVLAVSAGDALVRALTHTAHPYLLAGLVVAAIVTALGWLTDRAITAYVRRRLR
jgi:hypothetical protein